MTELGIGSTTNLDTLAKTLELGIRKPCTCSPSPPSPKHAFAESEEVVRRRPGEAGLPPRLPY